MRLSEGLDLRLQGMFSACLTHKGGSVPSVFLTQAAPALQFRRRAAREIAGLVSGAFTEGMGFIIHVIGRVFFLFKYLVSNCLINQITHFWTQRLFWAVVKRAACYSPVRSNLLSEMPLLVFSEQTTGSRGSLQSGSARWSPWRRWTLATTILWRFAPGLFLLFLWKTCESFFCSLLTCFPETARSLTSALCVTPQCSPWAFRLV